jgi:hypothetical protein
VGAHDHHPVGVAGGRVGDEVAVVRLVSISVRVLTRTTTRPATAWVYGAAPSAKLSPTTGISKGLPTVPMNSSVRSGLPSLKIMTA